MKLSYVLAVVSSMMMAGNVPADEATMLRLTKQAIDLPSNEQAKKISLYTAAIEEFPGFYLPWTNRAVCQLNYGKWDAAIADANEAIRLAPENPHPYAVRGRAYAGKRQFEQAFADLGRALQLAKTDEDTRNLYNDRGNAYFSARRYDEAIRDFEQAVDIDPTFAKGYNNLGIAYRAIGDYDKAIVALDTALKLDEVSPRALANRARVWVARNDPVMAEADLEKAVELDPKDSTILVQRGMFRFLNGQMQKARSDFAAALQADPRNPYAAIWRYLALASMGLKDDARLQLGSFLSEQPDPSLWPLPVAAMLLGKATPEQLIADAGLIENDAQKRERLAETHYYVAQMFQLADEEAKAKEQLTKAVEQSSPRTQEFILASVTLSGWKPPQPPPPKAIPSEDEPEPEKK